MRAQAYVGTAQQAAWEIAYQGMGRIRGEIFPFFQIFHQKKISKKLFFQMSPNVLRMFDVFDAPGRGEPWKNVFLCYWRGSKITLGRGDCVLEGQPMGIPPSPFPLPLSTCPPMGAGARKACPENMPLPVFFSGCAYFK